MGSVATRDNTHITLSPSFSFLLLLLLLLLLLPKLVVVWKGLRHSQYADTLQAEEELVSWCFEPSQP